MVVLTHLSCGFKSCVRACWIWVFHRHHLIHAVLCYAAMTKSLKAYWEFMLMMDFVQDLNVSMKIDSTGKEIPFWKPQKPWVHFHWFEDLSENRPIHLGWPRTICERYPSNSNTKGSKTTNIGTCQWGWTPGSQSLNWVFAICRCEHKTRFVFQTWMVAISNKPSSGRYLNWG